MTEIDIYLIGLGLLALLAIILGGIVWLQSRDLERAEDREHALHTQLAEERATAEALLADLDEARAHCQRYHVGELDRVIEATRPRPVEEDLEAAVLRTIAALPAEPGKEGQQ